MKHQPQFRNALFTGALLACLFACVSARADEVEFTYEAGADIVSAYLWRGQYNGGLSFQPMATIGFANQHVQFQVGAWASLSASDWKFTKGLEQMEGYNPNTYFIPEVDILCSLRSHGVTIGFTHFYYCDGTNFFNFGKIEDIKGTSQTDAYITIDGDDWLPEEHHAYIGWYTMVNGADANCVYDENGYPVGIKRAYSSYLEFGYDYTFTRLGLTLGAQLGIVPWRSDEVYKVEKAAVKCVALKLNKAWDLDVCEIDLYAQGMINPTNINKDNAYINASGDDKLYMQQLNAVIGIGFWF